MAIPEEVLGSVYIVTVNFRANVSSTRSIPTVNTEKPSSTLVRVLQKWDASAVRKENCSLLHI